MNLRFVAGLKDKQEKQEVAKATPPPNKLAVHAIFS